MAKEPEDENPTVASPEGEPEPARARVFTQVGHGNGTDMASS